MPEQPLKLNEELENKVNEMSSDENKDNKIEQQELEPITILNLLCKYVHENGIANDSALKEISPPKKTPKKPWWGYPGKIRKNKQLQIQDGENQLDIKELIFRPRWSEAKNEFSLAKNQHIIIINFETNNGTKKLQNIRIKYFYYLCKKLWEHTLREHTNNWNISVQDERSSTRNAEGRRKLKIFFGYVRTETSGTSDEDFQKWIGLFDEVYKFLAENRPKPEDLNTIPTPDYTRGWEVCGPLEDFCKKIYNDNMNADTEKTDKIEARNCIWAGAPGTGKSHDLNRQAQSKFAGNNMRVTFHPEYTYYDFVGTYRPKMALVEENEVKKKTIEYDFVPGPFAKMLKKAHWDRENEYCLIIEEINRANMAAVFGDVFQLLDRASCDSEDGKIKMHESEYAICPTEELYEFLVKDIAGKEQEKELLKEQLRLPANLYLWATMNSADQGVFPMDTAFKRRWSFKNMDIDPKKEEGSDYDPNSDWDQIRRGINDMLLGKNVQEDKLMGYYFLKDEERKDENLETALKEKVMLYLFEDAAKPFRKNVFKEDLNTCAKLRGKLDKNDSHLCVFKEKVWEGKGATQEKNDGGEKSNEQPTESQS